VAAASTRPLAAICSALALGAAIIHAAYADDAVPPTDDRVAFRIESSPHPGCPGVADLEASVLARTKKARRAAAGEEARVFHVDFQDEAGAVTGRLTVERNGQSSGVRALRGSSSDDEGTALSLTIALSIDPTARLAIEPPPAPLPSASPDAGAPCVPAPSPVATTTAEPAPTVVASTAAPGGMQARIGLAAGVTQVLAQGVMPIGTLSGEISGRSADLLSPSARLSVNFASNATDFAADATFMWLSGRVELCPIRARWFGSRLEVRPCATGQGGLLRARGRAVPVPVDASHDWWAAGLSAHIAALLSSGGGIDLSGSGDMSLHELDFVFQTPSRLIAQTASVSWTVSLGVFLTLP
jgi:hypothetical protein